MFRKTTRKLNKKLGWWRRQWEKAKQERKVEMNTAAGGGAGGTGKIGTREEWDTGGGGGGSPGRRADDGRQEVLTDPPAQLPSFLPSHPRSSNLFEDNMGANVTKASPICWLAWYGAKSIKPTFEFNVSWTNRVTHRAHHERCHQREPGAPQTSGVNEAQRARRPIPTWVGGPPPSPGRPKGRGIKFLRAK